MKCTVLGATGFIGSNLVTSLRTAGHEVFAPRRGDSDIFSSHLGHVFFCIGITSGFRTRPFETVRAHVSALADILERGNFDSLVYLSSTRVYSHSEAGTETGFVSIDVAEPSDLYNLSKLMGESLCRSCGRNNVRVARLSNVVGYDTRSGNFLFALIKEALTGRIELLSAPASVKDYILLDDVLRLLPRIAEEGREWLYNVASGVNLSHGKIAEQLAAITGCEWFARPGAPLFTFPSVDIDLIRAEFGFSPQPVLDALPSLVDSFRVQP